MRQPRATVLIPCLAAFFAAPSAFAEAPEIQAIESIQQVYEKMCVLPPLAQNDDNAIRAQEECRKRAEKAGEETARVAGANNTMRQIAITNVADTAKNATGQGMDEAARVNNIGKEERRIRARRYADLHNFFIESAEDMAKKVKAIQGDAEAYKARSYSSKDPRDVELSMGLEKYARQIADARTIYEKEAIRFAQTARKHDSEALELDRLADKARKSADELEGKTGSGNGIGLKDGIALGQLGVQGLGMLNKGAAGGSSGAPAPGSNTGKSLAGLSKNIQDTVNGAGDVADGAKSRLVSNDPKSYSGIGEYANRKSTLSSSSASVAPNRMQQARSALAKRGVGAPAGGGASGKADATYGNRGPASETAKAQSGEGDKVEYASSGGGSDLSLATSLGGEDLNIGDMINKMLGTEEESNAPLYSDTGSRSTASYGTGSSNLPDGVLNEDSGTLFDRVREANVRQIKSGRVLNGLNSKI